MKEYILVGDRLIDDHEHDWKLLIGGEIPLGRGVLDAECMDCGKLARADFYFNGRALSDLTYIEYKESEKPHGLELE